MALQKLKTTNAFVVRDLDTETPAIGIVRSAPKILQGGAKEMARSQTYQCAVLNIQMQGASCGVNAAPETRDAALVAFCEELLPAVESGSLILSPAKGVSSQQLLALTEVNDNGGTARTEVDGISNAAHLTGVGAVACAAVVCSLDGATVAIENFDEVGLSVASAAASAGAKIVAISTSAGVAMSPNGFALDALASALSTDGAAMINSLAEEEIPFWKILGTDADVLFAGSKMGLVDHKNAESVSTKLVVPTGALPYSTKGALMLERQGVTVLPDFVTTAGGLLSRTRLDGASPAEQEAAVKEQLRTITESIVDKAQMAILEACVLAEAFLATWREELPFGRPFAP